MTNNHTEKKQNNITVTIQCAYHTKWYQNTVSVKRINTATISITSKYDIVKKSNNTKQVNTKN